MMRTMEYFKMRSNERHGRPYILFQAKVNHDTQFYRIKDGVGVSPSPSPHLKELMKFYESCSQDDQVQLPSSVI